MSDAPADFIASQLRAIVGIEIDLRELKGKMEVSQNRSLEDRKGVAEGLAREDDAKGPAMAGTYWEAVKS